MKKNKNDEIMKEWQDKVDTVFCVLEADAVSLLYRLKDINKCDAKPTVFINLDKNLNEIINESRILLERLREKK